MSTLRGGGGGRGPRFFGFDFADFFFGGSLGKKNRHVFLDLAQKSFLRFLQPLKEARLRVLGPKSSILSRNVPKTLQSVGFELPLTFSVLLRCS